MKRVEKDLPKIDLSTIKRLDINKIILVYFIIFLTLFKV